MSSYNRSKLGYLETLQDVQDRIADHRLDQFDLVFLSKTNQLCIINPDLEIITCKTQFECYANESEANIAINRESYAYEGMIVMVQTELDGLRPYVCQLDSNNKLHVVAVNSGHSTAIADYNTLENIPVENITATNEILISDLTDGYYMVVGNYKISADDPTHRMTSKKLLFGVHHQTTPQHVDVVYITEFNSVRIKFYTVIPGSINEDHYVLESELEECVQTYLDTHADTYVGDYIDDHQATTQDIDNLFP